MKKFAYSALAALSAAPLFAETPAAVTVENSIGTLLTDTVQNTVTSATSTAWTVITAIVGVALLFWLGRALLGVVKSYFGAAS